MGILNNWNYNAEEEKARREENLRLFKESNVEGDENESESKTKHVEQDAAIS